MGVIRYNKQQTNRRGLTFTADPSRSSSDLEEINDFLAASQLLFDTYADTNLTLSGIQTINEVTGADGVRVLVNGQSDQNQNGGYVMRSGAWDRVNDSMYRGVVCVITGGNAYKDTMFIQSRPTDAPDGSSSAWFRRVDNRQVAVSSILASAFVSSFLGSPDASGGRSALGASTVGGNLLVATNPSAVTFIRVNADNTVTFRTPSELLTDIGAAASGSYLTASNNLSDVANAGTARTNLGLGTIATQAASNVNISGGQVTGLSRVTVTGSNSTMSVGTGNSATITAVSSGSVNLQSANANMRVLQDRIDGSMGGSSGSPLYFQATSGTNVSTFLQLQRTRNAGSQNIAIETQSVTNGGLNFSDAITWQKLITPNTGTQIYNAFQSVVTNNSTSTPASAEDIVVTQAGLSVRAMRVQSGAIRIYMTGVSHLYVGIAVPTLSAAYTITLPTSAPSGGQIVTYDGTGQMFFENSIYSCLRQVSSNMTMENNCHFYVTGDGSIRRVLTLPTNVNSRVGMYIRVSRSPYNLDSFRIAQNAVQRIYVDETSTTEGVTGYIDSDSIDTSLLLYCFDTDQSTFAMWQVVSKVGQIIIV